MFNTENQNKSIHEPMNWFPLTVEIPQTPQCLRDGKTLEDRKYCTDHSELGSRKAMGIGKCVVTCCYNCPHKKCVNYVDKKITDEEGKYLRTERRTSMCRVEKVRRTGGTEYADGIIR